MSLKLRGEMREVEPGGGGLRSDQEGPGATPRNLGLIFYGEQERISKCERGDLVESELYFLQEHTGH